MTRFGIFIFPTDRTIAPTELARAVEDRGFDSLYLPDHTHIPVESRSPFLPGGELPDHYRRTHDPFVALAAAAAVTSRIRLATGICLVSQRDPITLAKEVASLDCISNGRVVLGVGAGWNEPEVTNHGTVFEQRWRVTRERILAMRTIWREEEPEYHGKYVNFDRMWSYPKPVQPAGPPVWIGANSRFVPDRVAAYADGWMPVHGRQGGATVEMLRQACDRRGRDVGEISLALFFAPPERAVLDTHCAQGFSEFIFALASDPRDQVLARLDQLAAFVDANEDLRAA